MSPLARLFDNMPIGRKLFILAAIYTLPIAVLLYLLVAEKNIAIDFADKELRGTEYLRATRSLLEHVPQHRALLNAYLAGNASLRPAVLAKQAQISQDLGQLDAVDGRLGGVLRSTAKEGTLRASWQDLSGRALQLKASEGDDLNGKTVGQVRDLIATVGDSSNLILDPDLDSYYVMDNVVVKLPDVEDLLAQEMALASAIAAKKSITPDEKTQLVVLSGLVNSDLDTIQNEMATAFRNNTGGTLVPALDGPVKDAVGAGRAFQDLVGKRLIDAGTIDVTPDEVATSGQRALDANFALWDKAADQLDVLLRARIGGFNQNKYNAIGGVALVFVLVSLLGFYISRRLNRRIRALAAVADRIALGDVDQTIGERGRDEIGVLAQSFGQLTRSISGMIEESRSLITSAQEGKLDQRGDAEHFSGAYRDLVAGVNQMLDAITVPINEAAAVLDKVAAGDLTPRMHGQYRGDYAKIKATLNTALERLDQGLLQIAVSSDQVASAANSIAAGSQSLAQGASEQASALEQVSSSLQEMTAMTRRNAAAAQQARTLAEGARSTAERGVDSMGRLSGAIDRIKQSANETAKIMKTIDEIAFQTNLLALNAAVEAARAGDAGRGFAVVAGEVRNLAMRSADAARNTASLIEESVRNAENGVALNQEVLRNFADINDGVNKVGEVTVEIAAASDQQSEGIVQINAAVDQMNQVTQQNAANSEESAAAADELSSQANGMRATVGLFQLTNAPSAAPRPPRHAAHAKAGENGNGAAPKTDARKLIPFDDDQEVLKSF